MAKSVGNSNKLTFGKRKSGKALENNIEYFKEWSAIYQTQRDLARSKVSQLEMKVLQLQEIIRQYQNGTI